MNEMVGESNVADAGDFLDISTAHLLSVSILDSYYQMGSYFPKLLSLKRFKVKKKNFDKSAPNVGAY